MNDTGSHPDGGARLGPKATEDEQPAEVHTRALTLRAMIPNAITAAALCSGLTGIRFAIDEQWGAAVVAVILAGVLDGNGDLIENVEAADAKKLIQETLMNPDLTFNQTNMLAMMLQDGFGEVNFSDLYAHCNRICLDNK